MFGVVTQSGNSITNKKTKLSLYRKQYSDQDFSRKITKNEKKPFVRRYSERNLPIPSSKKIYDFEKKPAVVEKTPEKYADEKILTPTVKNSRWFRSTSKKNLLEPPKKIKVSRSRSAKRTKKTSPNFIKKRAESVPVIKFQLEIKNGEVKEK